jgi:BlaI family transcriptional regulator, penicillinase repressor
MPRHRFTPLELQIMEALWALGASSVREIVESLPDSRRPAFTTIQTTIYRLESKGAVRCVKRISNANIFEAAVTRQQAESDFADQLIAFFGGKSHRVMAHLAETGKLTPDDLEQIEKTIREAKRKRRGSAR